MFTCYRWLQIAIDLRETTRALQFSPSHLRQLKMSNLDRKHRPLNG